jgi:hypothetical protein
MTVTKQGSLCSIREIRVLVNFIISHFFISVMAVLKLINKFIFPAVTSVLGLGYKLYFKFRGVILCYGFMEVQT